MMKRIEFTLNLDDPTDAFLYEELAGLLRHRRAGNLIRQALAAFLFGNTHLSSSPQRGRPLPSPSVPDSEEPGNQADADTTRHLLDQSAAMFGF